MKQYNSYNLRFGRLGRHAHGITTVKRYGKVNTRIVYHASYPIAGLEGRNYSPKNSKNENKLKNNIIRARTTVQDLILCNDFQYFCTFTVSPEKYDRYDLKTIYKAFAKFIQNYNRLCDTKVSYIIIPEHHKNGAWHFHGVMSGIRQKDLTINQNGYLDWTSYSKRFGYMSLSPIRSLEKVSSYIQKYITKDLSNTVTQLGGHTFYASKGLKRPDTVFIGIANLRHGVEWDYEHPEGYCKFKTIEEDKTPLDSVLIIENDDYNSL